MMSLSTSLSCYYSPTTQRSTMIVVLAAYLLLALSSSSSSSNGGRGGGILPGCYAQQQKPKQQQQQMQKQLRVLGNANNNNNKNELIAVLHIGPMKTGSSAIQASMGIVVPELERDDHYEDAGFAMEKGIETYHMIGCFRPDSVPYDINAGFQIACHPNALEQVAKVATERNRNLIITAEFLTDPKTDLVKLKQFLQPWSYHKIVAYYRRYYDWLLSFHNEIYKKQTTDKRISIVDFLTKESKWKFLWETMYLIDSIIRYKNANFTNIQIINTYNVSNNDIRQAFYCDALPNAKSSCTKFTNYLQTEKKHIENPSIPLIYSDMAYYGKQMGLWNEQETNLSLKDVTNKIQYFQETVLKKTSYDFKEYNGAITCPSQDVIDYLLEQSIVVEKKLFNKYYYEQGLSELMIHFDSIKTTKLCHVNGQIVLSNSPIWQEFFRNLNTNNNNNQQQ